LRVYVVVVNGLRKFKFRIGAPKKGRALIFFACVNMSPVIKWFDVVHDFRLSDYAQYIKSVLQKAHLLSHSPTGPSEAKRLGSNLKKKARPYK
jgi:hypothetical protein